MPQLRSERLDVDTTPYYHLVSRCVRRAFLCGKDPYTGQDFEYRREWVEARLFELTRIFAVDLHAYAVMSNHLHIVVRVDRDRAERWSESEVVRRYGKLFGRKPKELETLSAREKKERVAAWRERLWSLSWLMRCLNESIARRANAEDECTGHFWEGRFRCQPLLDEAALLTCMAYVDLNPVRAGIANSLKGSKHTSVAKRIAQLDAAMASDTSPVPSGLAPFADQVPSGSRRVRVPMHLVDYLELLTWTGREVRARGPSGTLKRVPVSLRDLNLDPSAFIAMMKRHGLKSVSVLGTLDAIDSFADGQGKAWMRGIRLAKALTAP
ncbi:MAG: transposase [Myxococcota bacterium]